MKDIISLVFKFIEELDRHEHFGVNVEFGLDETICGIDVYDATISNVDCGLSYVRKTDGVSEPCRMFEFYNGELWVEGIGVEMHLTRERMDLASEILKAIDEYNKEVTK